jgi:TolB-like protein/Tfp pilus assembly protein PilF
MSFLGEIKRRKVFQVAAVYAVVSWLVIQIIDVVNEPLNLPDWLDTVVIVLLAVGFPVAVVLAWAFDLTPEGVVKDQGTNITAKKNGRRVEYVLIGLLVIAVGWLVYRDIGPSDGLAPRENDLIPNSVAVLTFDNLSADPDDAYFAAGIHESTLNQLAKIRDLVVIARTSVKQYEQDPPPIPEIAKALHVEMVMEGSVRYANGRVLITAQLIDGRSGAHLWSEEFNRNLTDVFAIQVEVAEQIAAALRIQLLPEAQQQIESRPTESAEAYQHYLRSLSMPDALEFPEFFPVQIDLLKSAIAVDPKFAEAYAELAWVYYTRPAERYLAVQYAEQAIAIDPTVGRAHFVIGMRDRYYYARQDDARVELQRAIKLSPNDLGVAVQASRHLAEQSGQYNTAIQLAQRAVAVEPDADFIHHQLAFLLLRAGDPAAAAEQFKESIRLYPSTYTTYMDLAAAEFLAGNRSAAKENLDIALQIMRSGATFRVDYLAYLYGLIGEPNQAVELLAKQGASAEDPLSEVWETLGWAILGTRDQERALEVWQVTIDGYLNDDKPVSLGRITRFRDNWLKDPILEQPEFLELRRRLGFKVR